MGNNWKMFYFGLDFKTDLEATKITTVLFNQSKKLANFKFCQWNMKTSWELITDKEK